MRRSSSFLMGAALGGTLVIVSLVMIVSAVSTLSGAVPEAEPPVVATGLGGSRTTVPAPTQVADRPLTWNASTATCVPDLLPDLDLGWETAVIAAERLTVGQPVELRLVNPYDRLGDAVEGEAVATVTDGLGGRHQLSARLEIGSPAVVRLDAPAVGDWTVVWTIEGVGYVACHGFSVSAS